MDIGLVNKIRESVTQEEFLEGEEGLKAMIMAEGQKLGMDEEDIALYIGRSIKTEREYTREYG